jgi:hypothetical protein
MSYIAAYFHFYSIPLTLHCTHDYDSVDARIGMVHPVH